MKLLSLVEESGAETGTVRSDLRGGGRCSVMSPGTGGAGECFRAGDSLEVVCFSDSIFGERVLAGSSLFIDKLESIDVICVILRVHVDRRYDCIG